MTFLWRAAGSERPEVGRNPFKDIKEGTYYYDAVLWAFNNGITSGINETEFGSDETCTRGQIVSFLWRMLGRPDIDVAALFKDISENAFYYKPVLWAMSEGVTKGTSEQTFSPDDDCARAQIVTFLYRILDNRKSV